jgi:hypothetical protein
LFKETLWQVGVGAFNFVIELEFDGSKSCSTALNRVVGSSNATECEAVNSKLVEHPHIMAND